MVEEFTPRCVCPALDVVEPLLPPPQPPAIEPLVVPPVVFALPLVLLEVRELDERELPECEKLELPELPLRDELALDCEPVRAEDAEVPVEPVPPPERPPSHAQASGVATSIAGATSHATRISRFIPRFPFRVIGPMPRLATVQASNFALALQTKSTCQRGFSAFCLPHPNPLELGDRQQDRRSELEKEPTHGIAK